MIDGTSDESTAREPEAAIAAADPTTRAAANHGRLFAWSIGFGGIGLPILALLCAVCAPSLEREVGVARSIPTWIHMLAILAVPISIGFAQCVESPPAASPMRRALLALGFAFGVSTIYCIAFLPGLPLGIIGIIFFGMGLVALAPFFAFGALLVTIVHLVVRSGWPGRRAFKIVGAGFLLGIATLAVAERGSITVLSQGNTAADPDPLAARDAVKTLRAVDAGPSLRSMAVQGRRGAGPVTFLYGCLTSPRPITARTIGFPALEPSALSFAHWRVTGRSLVQMTQGASTDEQFVFDLDVTDPRVASSADLEGDFPGSFDASLAFGVLDHVGLAVAIDSATALATATFDLELRNPQSRITEGVVEFDLPADAVATDLRLFIGGEERASTVTDAHRATLAYESIVVKRRDPALLTRVDPGTVRLRLFPIVGYGVMRAKVEFLLPLERRGQRMELKLPHILRGAARNSLANYDVAVTADRPLLSVAGIGGASNCDRFEQKLSTPEMQRFERDNTLSIPAEDGNAGPFAFASQRADGASFVARRVPLESPERSGTVVAIDGSTLLRRFAPGLRAGIRGLETPEQIAILLGCDDGAREVERDEIDRELADDRFHGGNDNGLLLIAALEFARAHGMGRVVWIPASSPYPTPTLARVTELLGAADAPRVVHLARSGSPVWLADRLSEQGRIARRAFDGNEYGRSIDDVLAEWNPSSEQLSFENATTPASADFAAFEKLRAARAVARLTRTASTAEREVAMKDAVASRIVTAASAAVVLETKEDYERFGIEVPPDTPRTLAPATPSTGASIGSGPDGSILASLLLAGVVLARLRRRA